MRQVRYALLGLGTVNRGLYRMIQKQKSALYAMGYELILDTVVVRDLEKAKAFIENESVTFSQTIDSLLNDTSVEIVFEALSGSTPAGRYIYNLLESGKFVVSANKAAIAENYDVLMECAMKHRKRLYFEAAVCAGTPVIQTLERLVKVDRVKSIQGILNGTTNYILNTMAHEKASYEVVLNKAKELGYAEADERADVDGIDAANKLCLLIALAFDEVIDPQTISKDSISQITAVERGHKVISKATINDEGRVEATVSLECVKASHPFYTVPASQNILMLEMETLGTLVFTGPGAGGDETGTAMYLDWIRLIEEKRL